MNTNYSDALVALAEQWAQDAAEDTGNAAADGDRRSETAAEIRQDYANSTVQDVTLAQINAGDTIYWDCATHLVDTVTTFTVAAHAEYRGVRSNRPVQIARVTCRGALKLDEPADTPIFRITR
jgi:hypothetical protein